MNTIRVKATGSALVGSVSLLAVAGAVLGACGSKGSAGATATDGSVAGDDGGEGSSGVGASSGASSGAGASSGSASSGAGASSGGSSSDGGASSSSGSTGIDGGDGAAPYDYSVYQHHKNGTRNGLYIDPMLTWTPGADGGTGTGNAVTTHVLTMSEFPGAVQTAYMGTTSTGIYAQPLYVENGPGGAPAFVVATELNHVTTYNATTGAILWDNGPSSTITYGDPVVSGLPCGNITPIGITGTPIIDYSSGEGVIYFDAMTSATPNAKHMVWAVKVADGSPLPNWPVDVSAKVTDFNSPYQNQRGALQFVNGTLYVPYGGLNGDCIDLSEPYYGWVVAIPASNPQQPTSWHTAANRGGIWGPGALPTDGTYVYPVTGNTSASGTTGFTAPSTWGGGEAVIRLGAGATFSGMAADYYTPSNWATLDDGDTDLGGASEVLFDLAVPGGTTMHLVGVGGKDSNFYILDRDNLGGLGKELFKATLATNQFKGAPAAYTTKKGTYVAFHVEGGSGSGCSQGGNLVVIKVTPGSGTANPTAAVAWCSVETGLGSPIVTTTDGTSDAIVWDANNHLYAYDGDTGVKLFNGANTEMDTSIQGWNTPIAIGVGRLAVLVNGELFVFSAP
jgi:hypothetical protein